MFALIGFDGISANDLAILQPELKKTGQALSKMALLELTSIFREAQPFWAELLTGSPWFENGCTSYARPTDSLNTVEVVSESELYKPVLFQRTAQLKPVFINIPVLRPNSQKSIWLSDGSLPINAVVSPRALSSEAPFASYKARPFPSIDCTSGTTETLVQRCLDVEKTRLACAVELFNRRLWSSFCYRISLFDQLSHLLGLNFLAAKDLQVWKQIEQFIQDLDEAFDLFLREPGVDVLFISGYSHHACRGLLNLNSFLQTAGFLNVKEALPEVHADRRHERVAVAQPLLKERPVGVQSSSLDGRLEVAGTSAASPVASCVFINSNTAFRDGSVDSAAYASVREAVRTFLSEAFLRQFGHKFTIEENPDASMPNRPVPEFIVNIEGIEFYNLTDYVPLPQTTHAAGGFLLAPKRFATQRKLRRPSEIAEFINLA